MNIYQAKLEAIKSRRLTGRQRLVSMIQTFLWLCCAFMVPALIGMTWRFADLGYGHTQPLIFTFAILNSLALMVLFVYSLIKFKKLMTLSFSGINK